MLPKSGDSSQPTNWRPIAALKITYKIFSRLLYNRLRAVMNEQQPNDQTGFRPNTGIIRWCICGFGMPFFEIFGMECSDMVCKARLDEGVWSHRVQPFFRKVSHAAIALCCGNFARDRLAQCMGAKGSTLNAGKGKVMSSAQTSSMQDWNMPGENGKPSWFIMGCSSGMVAGWPTFDMLMI